MSSSDSVAPATPSIDGIVTKHSPFSVEETLKRLQEAMRNRGLTVFARISHSGEAERIGLKMPESHVLIFGNPKAGSPLIVASPLLGLDLPPRVLVWQENDSHVWVSYTSVEYLAARYSIPQELVGNIAGIDRLIEGVLHSS
jgi:uncharacterized protein (DUF302 family)